MSDQAPQILFEKDRLHLGGELTIYNAATVAAELVARWSEQALVEVDLSSVEQLDCAGLQLLLTLKQHNRSAARDFRISQASAAVQSVLLLCQLSDRLEHVPAAAPEAAAAA